MKKHLRSIFVKIFQVSADEGKGKKSKLGEFSTQTIRKKDSKKIWLSMHPRNFASHESVRPSVRTKGKQLMWNDLFYFVWRLQPAFNLMINVLVMVILATWTFREKKRQQSQVFFRLHFNVYDDVDNRERTSIERERR